MNTLRSRALSGLQDFIRVYSSRGIDRAATAVDVSAELVMRLRVFFISLILTTIYALPGLVNHSRNTGYLYTGDVFGLYWPVLAKTHDLVARLHFVATNFSLFNGSSDYFLTTNIYEAHPLLILYSLLTRNTFLSMEDYGHALAWLIAIHMFIFFYWSLKLIFRYTNVAFPAALFGAAFCAFGVGTVANLGEPEFLFTVSAMPWMIYAALDFERDSSLLRLPAAAAPGLFVILGGYLPIGVACFFLATVFIAAHVLFIRAPLPSTRERLLALLRSSIPIASGLLVACPYVLATFNFFKSTPSATSPSLYFSAHQMAELPQTFLRILSPSLTVTGPFWDFSLQWGLIPFAVLVLFVSTSAAPARLTAEQWRTLKFCGAVYAATVLAIYGTFSAVSDLVFLFVPQVGKMHIYQRFLYPGSVLMGIALAIMLQALSQIQERRVFGFAAFISIILTLLTAFTVAYYPQQAANIGLNNSILLEFILLMMYLITMTVPGYRFKIAVALALASIPTINLMYNWTRVETRYADQKTTQPLFLDIAYQNQVISFMREHSSKAIIKYEDVTPLWEIPGIEMFPKSFPYLVLDRIKLSSYTGFAFYLSPRADYMSRMPIVGPVKQSPDWTWLQATHADFIVAKAEELPKLEAAGYLDQAPGTRLTLPKGMVMAALKFARQQPGEPSPVFDNGYFHIAPAIDENRFANRGPDLALHRPTQQSSLFSTGVPERAVDGNTDGNFIDGSVTHTAADPNAWWEVDLGNSKEIGNIVLWNRTDCCVSRLSDTWLFVSDTPFGPKDTAAMLRRRPGTWSHFLLNATSQVDIAASGAKGRYVRVQFDGSDRGREAYLSLAEVQVFQDKGTVASAAPLVGGNRVSDFFTNDANRFHLHVSAVQPLDIAYQFWGNSDLRYKLDGHLVDPIDRNGLKVVMVGPGEHDFDMYLTNPLLTIFWFLFFLFWLAVLLTLAIRIWVAGRVLWIEFEAAGSARR